MLVSDTGQRHNPLPPEALRLFAQGLFEKGVPEEDIYTMIKDNPADLLELGPPEPGLADLTSLAQASAERPA